MELSKKTTILLSPDMHARLSELAATRKTSIGELVRRAVADQYGLVDREARIRAARRMGELSLPVGDVGQIKRESMPEPKELPE